LRSIVSLLVESGNCWILAEAGFNSSDGKENTASFIRTDAERRIKLPAAKYLVTILK
jgi:hypothetical protein